MKIYIDQSGKVEDTAKPTVIGFSNDRHGSVIILANEKRFLQEKYRQAGKPRVFVPQVFAVLVYLLLNKFKLYTKNLIVDPEYPKYEPLILSYLRQLVPEKYDLNLRFFSIGKRNAAHSIVNKNLREKKADSIVTAKDVLALVLRFKH